MTKTIKFKSTPENFRKELLGLKCNTLRRFKLNDDDIRKKILIDFIINTCNIINITIINTVTKEEFTRRVTDITKWDEWFIISWKDIAIIV